MMSGPFFSPIAWALIIAVTFQPAHARIHKVIRNRSAAALVSIVIVLLIFIVPAMLLGLATVSEFKTHFRT